MPPRQERSAGSSPPTAAAKAKKATPANPGSSSAKSPPAVLTREAFKASFLLFQGAVDASFSLVPLRREGESERSAREERRGGRETGKLGENPSIALASFFLLFAPPLESRTSSSAIFAAPLPPPAPAPPSPPFSFALESSRPNLEVSNGKQKQNPDRRHRRPARRPSVGPGQQLCRRHCRRQGIRGGGGGVQALLARGRPRVGRLRVPSDRLIAPADRTSLCAA